MQCALASALLSVSELKTNPGVPADALLGLQDHDNIKLRSAGYRLV